jgi:G3E family GTPase
VAYSDPAAHLVEPLLSVIDGLGPALVRAKGFVRLSGEHRRGYLERAGLHTSLQLGDSWGIETPRTEIVLIGEGLDAAAIQRQLWACRVVRKDQ